MNDSILQDVSSTGKVRPWREHKMANEILALAYESVDPHKAERLRGCATELTFLRTPEGKLTLGGTWFCRVRLCPMCTWRRSLKVAKQMTVIMDEIKKEHSYKYILLTLTMRNCGADEVDESVTKILRSYNNLTKLKAFQDASKGWYRSLEITHNLEDDTYHPHIHAVIAVPAGYFSGGRYISQEKWTSLWQRCLGVEYTPIVDVRKIKGDTSAAVAEVAKYAVKSSDYIIPHDWDLTVATVRILDAALHNRRFIAYGGICKEIHKRLNLEKPEEGDLVNIDKEATSEAQGVPLTFIWYSGFRQYQKLK